MSKLSNPMVSDLPQPDAQSGLVLCHCGSGRKRGAWKPYCCACEQQWRDAQKRLNTGDVFRRQRGFCRPPEGYRQDHWWTASSNYPATDYGWEYVEVIEVVNTVKCGRLIIYCTWWVDPDGNEVKPTRDWIPDKNDADIGAEDRLRRSLAQKGLKKVESQRQLVDHGLHNMTPIGSA